MRKAGVAIRGATKGRRKDKESSSSPQQSTTTTTTGQPLTQEQVAAITAKNYRLAKELSELRVRHREECRNVTRLSMDNINLASKCREAIKHAKALKAEVKAHRQRLRQLGELGTAAAASTATSPTSTNASAVSPKSTMDDAEDDDTLLLSSRSSEGDDEEKKSEGHDDARQPRRRPEHPTTATSDPSHVPILLQQPPPPSAKLQAEMERMDRILAEHAQRDRCCIEEEEPQHQPSLPTLRTNSSEEEEDGIAQPPHEQGGLYMEEPPPQPLETPSARDFDSGIGCSENGSPLISSDDFDEDVTDEEEEDEQNRNHEDEAAADTEEDDEDAYDSTSPLAADNNVSSALDHHHRTPSPSWETHFLPSPQFKFYDEEYPQDISSVSVRSSKDSADHYSNSIMLGGVQEEESAFGNGGPTPSSMDAFEASFNIGAFPESFSPREQERHPRDKNNGRTSPDAGSHRAPIRRDFTKSPPPQPILMDETKTEDPTTSSVYDPFTYSPRNDEVYRKSALPSQSRPDLEPLVIKWGTRARDRMRAASDPPAASFNSNYNKKLSVRQVVDLSSSSMEEPAYHAALTPPASVGSKIKDNASSDVNNTTLSPRSVSSASATGSGGSPTKDKRSPPIWDGVRSMLPFNKSSPRKGASSSSPQHDPSTPTQYHRNSSGGDVYSTPPSSAASSSMQSSEDSYNFEPKRPEKAGYDAARAKYEKATRPRPGKLDACASTSENVMYSESTPVEEPAATSSSPSRNRQLSADAQLLASVSVKDRAAAFRVSPPRQDMPSSTRNSFSKLRTGPSYDDSDGDIPLNTSISRSQVQDDDDDPRSNLIYADRDDEFMPPQRPVWEEDDGPGTALFTVIREDTSRPYSPYELESQLKRRSPLGSDFALADATHEAASLV